MQFVFVFHLGSNAKPKHFIQVGKVIFTFIRTFQNYQ